MNQSGYIHQGYEVSALSAARIHETAEKTRAFFGECVDSSGRIDVVRLLELRYGEFDIVETHKLPNAMGKTLADGCIVIREDVYDGACAGNGRDRFTIAHEIGHAILHGEQIGMCRATNSNTAIYRNSEWQANEYAGALLLPNREVKRCIHAGMAPPDIAANFGISEECATIRIKKAYRQIGLGNQGYW